MKGADDTAKGSEGRSAAVAKKAKDGNSNAGNHAHSCLFPVVRREAQRFARANQH